MQGGEIFVPKIPSMRIVDLASAMAPAMAQKIVGIRAGEKLHEVMCPSDDSHLTLEFADHFVLQPTIKFTALDVSYTKNALGESGTPVEQGFEYGSDKNKEWLTQEQLLEMIERV